MKTPHDTLIMKKHKKRLEVEAQQAWIIEAESIPYLQFPSDWQVQIIPPFSDAVIRFRVRLPSGLVKSVFLDTRGALENYFNKEGKSVPYWEVSPVAGKLGRCEKHDIKMLLEMIAYEDDE